MSDQVAQLSIEDARSFFLWFYQEYTLYVYKQAWQYCNHPNDIEDLVQEVWAKLCAQSDKLSQLSKEQHFSYIAATVRNTVISSSRKSSVELSLDAAYGITYNEADILNRIMDKQLSIQHFKKVWPLVPASSREILERKYFLEESDAEIAQALGRRRPAGYRLGRRFSICLLPPLRETWHR